jgi:hypothetical protein
MINGCNGYEVFDALTDAKLENSEEYTKDMLFWLYHNLPDSDETFNLRSYIEEWFVNHNWCIKCGQKLKYYEYKEYHYEVNADEEMGEYYCPDCDLKNVDRINIIK